MYLHTHIYIYISRPIRPPKRVASDFLQLLPRKANTAYSLNRSSYHFCSITNSGSGNHHSWSHFLDPQPPLRIFHNHLLAKSIQGNQPRGSDKCEPSKGPKGLNLLKFLHHSKSDFTIQQFHSYFCLQRPSCIRQDRAEKVFNCVGCAYWEHQAAKQFSSLFNICPSAV